MQPGDFPSLLLLSITHMCLAQEFTAVKYDHMFRQVKGLKFISEQIRELGPSSR